jgi:hypothetical protein
LVSLFDPVAAVDDGPAPSEVRFAIFPLHHAHEARQSAGINARSGAAIGTGAEPKNRAYLPDEVGNV